MEDVDVLKSTDTMVSDGCCRQGRGPSACIRGGLGGEPSRRQA